MKFSLVGNVKEKIGYHQGLFTRSYQEARAVYDAKIRSWEIELKDNLFVVKNSDDVVELVFYNRRIANCSCDHFIETECGTCMHIEAVRLIDSYELVLPKVRPITFVDSTFKIETWGADGEPFLTPSVEK